MPKFVNLIAFLQKLISKEHVVVIMKFPDWGQVKMKILYKYYNLLEAGSFLIRKLNQPTSCLMLQFKGKNKLKLPFDNSFK